MAKRSRKPKSVSPNPGLTPPTLLDQIKKELGDGKDLQDLRKPNPAKKRTVLPEAREGEAGATGPGGVFGTDDVHDGERGTGREQTPVSDAERAGRSLDIAISERLRDFMQERMPNDDCTYLDGMLRQVVLRASQGEQWAIDFVANRIEGKPGQAPRKTTTIEDVEAAISQVEMSVLDSYMESDDETPTQPVDAD